MDAAATVGVGVGIGIGIGIGAGVGVGVGVGSAICIGGKMDVADGVGTGVGELKVNLDAALGCWLLRNNVINNIIPKTTPRAINTNRISDETSFGGAGFTLSGAGGAGFGGGVSFGPCGVGAESAPVGCVETGCFVEVRGAEDSACTLFVSGRFPSRI